MTTHTYSATTFPRFNKLPKELRLSIWEFAIPGPRIVEVVERSIKPTLSDLSRQINAFIANPNIIPQELAGTFKSDKEILERLQWIYEHHLSSQPLDEKLLDNSAPLTNFYSPGSGVPAVLFACHESHSVACKLYDRAFDSRESVMGFGETWFGFERDVLYLRWDTWRANASLTNPNSTGGILMSESPTSVNGAFKNLIHALPFTFDPETRQRIRNLAILIREDELEDEGFTIEWIVEHVIFAFSGLRSLDLVLRHVERSERSERSESGDDSESERGAELWDLRDVEDVVQDLRGGMRGEGELSLVTLKQMRGVYERFVERGLGCVTPGVDVRFRFVVGG